MSLEKPIPAAEPLKIGRRPQSSTQTNRRGSGNGPAGSAWATCWEVKTAADVVDDPLGFAARTFEGFAESVNTAGEYWGQNIIDGGETISRDADLVANDGASMLDYYTQNPSEAAQAIGEGRPTPEPQL